MQKLSLGNQQRVQLAAALVHDPDVLVLDEPFSGLDPVAVDVMSQVLREKAAAGVPVVFSSHQLDLVERLCDRVGIVSSGPMVAVGTVDELRARRRRRGSSWMRRGAGRTGPTGWPACGSSSRRRRGRVLELADGVDDQAVLHAALAAGPVHEFSPAAPVADRAFPRRRDRGRGAGAA